MDRNATDSQIEEEPTSHRRSAFRGRIVSLSPAFWWRWLRQWRRVHLRVDRAAVLQHVDEAGAPGPRFAFMTLMSCGIAILGLLQNSAAVIIGAAARNPATRDATPEKVAGPVR